MAAGSWIWGTVAQNYSLTWALEGAAGALLLVAAAGKLLPIRPWEESDQGAFDFTPPELALNLKSWSGPIVIKVEYSIAEENIAKFLSCMRERRRVQSRAGARDWTLQRDLQKPTLWTETFRTPTWTDYLRLNHRLTVTDREVGERLAALQVGGSPPHLALSIERSTNPAPGSQVQPVPFVSRP
ncbi:hypothetical protein X750_31115 [Mesorhizobium sp. LNJC394B00]|nr:hypothetical protein X750_31115 [Mesorhizobium sp. LNJC394B00]